jgi:hypothetical protein
METGDARRRRSDDIRHRRDRQRAKGRRQTLGARKQKGRHHHHRRFLGVQSIIASLANFFNAVGLELPPFATLSVLWQAQAKNKDTPRQELLEKYEKDYASTADKMIAQFVG